MIMGLIIFKYIQKWTTKANSQPPSSTWKNSQIEGSLAGWNNFKFPKKKWQNLEQRNAQSA